MTSSVGWYRDGVENGACKISLCTESIHTRVMGFDTFVHEGKVLISNENIVDIKDINTQCGQQRHCVQENTLCTARKTLRGVGVVQAFGDRSPQASVPLLFLE